MYRYFILLIGRGNMSSVIMMMDADIECNGSLCIDSRLVQLPLKSKHDYDGAFHYLPLILHAICTGQLRRSQSRPARQRRPFDHSPLPLGLTRRPARDVRANRKPIPRAVLFADLQAHSPSSGSSYFQHLNSLKEMLSRLKTCDFRVVRFVQFRHGAGR